MFAKTAIKAVDDVTFEIPQEPLIMSLTGESGSGKTSIARLILRQYLPTTGEIRYKGKDIHHLSRPESKTYYQNVQAIFQDPYSAYNPVYRMKRVLHKPITKFNLSSDPDSLIAEALETVGLNQHEVLDKYPHELSGGQLQRIMLARVFIIRPDIIVADEPISMLDASLSASILNMMREIKEQQEISILYITHDLSSAEYISDEIMVLYKGSIVEQGDVNKVLGDPVHPYTQLLIASIPTTDPEKRWKTKVELKAAETIHYLKTGTGCKFHSRCPHASTKCETVPQRVNVGSNHHVWCYLYE